MLNSSPPVSDGNMISASSLEVCRNNTVGVV